MLFEIPTTKAVDIKFVRVVLPLRDNEDMPEDFPLRKEAKWEAIIDIETGIIEGWPQGMPSELHIKVVDTGSYYLMDADRNDVLSIEQYYVPHGVIPGSYGDYVELKIDETGQITNFKKRIDLSEFLEQGE